MDKLREAVAQELKTCFNAMPSKDGETTYFSITVGFSMPTKVFDENPIETSFLILRKLDNDYLAMFETIAGKFAGLVDLYKTQVDFEKKKEAAEKEN